MKIGQAIKERGYSLSFEFFPPKDEVGQAQLLGSIAKLASLSPTFVSVTYGAGGSTTKNTQQMVLRIRRETSLVPMPHITCVYQSQEELKDMLADYQKHGIENVLALRGDPPEMTGKLVPPKGGLCHGEDLVRLAASFASFSIGVAVYPEGHCESLNLDMDMRHTKQKIDAGADFAITQMFFDNRYYYDFLERSAKVGIEIPIIAGIMPITDIGRIRRFSLKCGAMLPYGITKRFQRADLANPGEIRKIGIEVATEQCADLLEHGVHYFHFYTLNQTDIVSQIVNSLGFPNPGTAKLQSSTRTSVSKNLV